MMKNLMLTNDLIILDREKLKATNGGSIFWGLVGAAIYDCIANHEAFVKGFMEGYRDHT